MRMKANLLKQLKEIVEFPLKNKINSTMEEITQMILMN